MWLEKYLKMESCLEKSLKGLFKSLSVKAKKPPCELYNLCALTIIKDEDLVI